MSPGCPKCGYTLPRGRPKQLDDTLVKRAYLAKYRPSLGALAKKFGVTRGAIQASLKRSFKKAQT